VSGGLYLRQEKEIGWCAMKGIVIACGLEPEQLERLDQALPDDYMFRVEDCLCDGVYSDAICCFICEDGIEKEDIHHVSALWAHMDSRDKTKTVWIGGYPPILAFEHYKDFDDVLHNLNDILQEGN